MTRPKIRLLMADDSVYMQMALRIIIDAHPEIEIAGEASDGEQAVRMARELAPDVITMDINMPGVNGLEATSRIMAQAPVPIIMLSSLTERGVATTLRALELGAVDYVSKSSSAIDIDLATIADQVVAKIKFWGSRKDRPSEPVRHQPPALPASTDLLLIASGTGDPGRVSRMLRDVPALPFPVLVVQTMPPSFTRPFVDYLARTICMPVQEGRHGSLLACGSVTVMPGDRKGAVARQDSGSLTLELARTESAPGGVIPSALRAASSPLVIVLSNEACPPDGMRQALRSGRGRGRGTLWAVSSEACGHEDLVQGSPAGDLESVTCNIEQLADALRQGVATAAA